MFARLLQKWQAARRVIVRAARAAEGFHYHRGEWRKRRVFRKKASAPASSEPASVLGTHIDGHLHDVLTAPKDHALERADVLVVPAPREEDVPLLGNLVVGGVEVHPPGVAAEQADPGVSGVRAD